MLVFCVIGRMFQYQITDPGLMLACDIGIFLEEILNRLTVDCRDRAYARAFACMSRSGVKQLFGQQSNVKFSCDCISSEMMIESAALFFAMFACFTQMAYVRKTANPAEPFNMG